MQKFLPDWVESLEIAKPVGVFSYRNKDGGTSMFLRQLRDPEFERILLPSDDAGTDFIFREFRYSTPEDHQNNVEAMSRSNWYKSDPAMNTLCSKDVQGRRFVHLRFEITDTVPTMETDFAPGTVEEDEVIRVTLESEFAIAFFGKSFVAKYKKFARQ
ncbi:hypothetical protein HDU81_006297 [Chytriomyces hyalinus]|nr:hypothetical protein HDU81_006297 [Chytriomyces hyalinus]